MDGHLDVEMSNVALLDFMRLDDYEEEYFATMKAVED